jgi:ribosomal protein S6
LERDSDRGPRVSGNVNQYGRRQLKEYEALFIFANSLKEDPLQQTLGQIKDEITKLGGQVTATHNIGKRGFARTLKGMDGGQYVRMEMTLDPDKISALHARLKLNEKVFRTQIVKAEKIEAEKATAETEGEADAGGE